MKIQIFLFPEYMKLSTVAMASPRLFAVLREYGVSLEVKYWSGKVDESLVSDRPALVFASNHQIRCSQTDLARECARFGHLVFYDDVYLNTDGKTEGASSLVEAAAFFLEGVPA